MIHAFGGYELDLAQYEIRHSGMTVPVEPQVFDVLAYLVEHRDRVVSKEELLDNVWGDRFVSESALTSRIKSVRQAVGDSGRAQAVVKTVHGRGYRFVAAVTTGDGPPAPPPPGRPAPVLPVPSVNAVPHEPWPLLGRHRQLNELRRRFEDPTCGGLVLTGPAGVGKTRLARGCIDLAVEDGWPVVLVNGHAEAREVPLACLGHLLPDGIIATGELDGELARAILFQRARRAVGERAGGRRMLMMVDDADQTDPLSRALIGSLVSSGTVFAVLTQRTTAGEPLALDELVRSGYLVRLELEPLPEDVLDVLLYRVLSGTIERNCLRQLTAASGGSPGILRQLVETSIARATLVRRDNVWVLDGPLAATSDMIGLVEDRLGALESEHRRAAELLALAGSLDLDVAMELVGEEVLDALDLQGMLAITNDSGCSYVGLAHPIFGEVLRDRLGALRARRHKRHLADAIEAFGPGRAVDRLRLVRWRLDTGGEIDAGSLMETARLALYERDDAAASHLIERLARDAPSAEVAQLEAELMFRRGQMARAESFLAEIDLGELDETSAAQVVRRRATNLFFGHWRFREALDLLAAGFDQVSGDARQTLESHWSMLSAFHGDVTAALAAGEPLLTSPSELVRLEALRGVALARVLAGSLESALETTAAYYRLAGDVPPSLARAGRDTTVFAEVLAHLELGNLRQAEAVIRREAPPGSRTQVGWVPLAAARVELAAGRPAQAEQLLAAPLEMARNLGLHHAERLLSTMSVMEAVAQGDLDRAEAASAVIVGALDESEGLPRYELLQATTHVTAALGDPDGAAATLIEAAGEAEATGMNLVAAEMLATAAQYGAAEAVAPRLAALAATIDGALWPVRVSHVRALAAGADLAPIVQQYEALGYRWHAAAVRG
jgi:DNA-binding winged helix-turn-helix (wHTH) protein